MGRKKNRRPLTDRERKLVETHFDLARAVVASHTRGMRDDLEQEAALALAQCATRWNGSSKFWTFALPRVRGAILDLLRKGLPKGYRRAGDRPLVMSNLPAEFGAAESPDAAPMRAPAEPFSSEDLDLSGVDDRDEAEAIISRCSASSRDKLLLKLHFFRGMTLKRAGEVLGIGESRASQIVNHLKPRLREAARRIVDAGR